MKYLIAIGEWLVGAVIAALFGYALYFIGKLIYYVGGMINEKDPWVGIFCLALAVIFIGCTASTINGLGYNTLKGIRTIFKDIRANAARRKRDAWTKDTTYIGD